jgi:branched-chain amino acid transport system ATP-binding protein
MQAGSCRAARSQRRRQDDAAALVLGLTRARRGRVAFDGRDVTAVPTHEIARAGVGWVPDDRRVFPALTVSRNLSIARKRTRFRGWTLKECFEVFSALEHLQARECENLSGGEMQMVAIARVLLGAPGCCSTSRARACAEGRPDVMRTILHLKKASRCWSSSRTSRLRWRSPTART